MLTSALAARSSNLTSTQLSAITSITGPLPTYQFYAAALMNVCVEPVEVDFYAGENTTTWALERTFHGGSVGVGIPGAALPSPLVTLASTFAST